MKALVIFGMLAMASSLMAEEGVRRPPFGRPGELFKRLDKDGDGRIAKEEFFAAPRFKRLSVGKREKLFSRLDQDGDGSISRREIGKLRKMAQKRARAEFRALDLDKSGGLSFAEFNRREFIGKLPEEKRRRIFGRMDTDGDGEVTPKDKPKDPPRPQR